jgi:hypothetical protein
VTDLDSARREAIEGVGQWLHLDPTAWERRPDITATVDALIAQPALMGNLLTAIGYVFALPGGEQS